MRCLIICQNHFRTKRLVHQTCFWFSYAQSQTLLGLLVTVSCFPQANQARWCTPGGEALTSMITTITGTNHLPAPCSCFNDAGLQYCPFWLNVSKFSWRQELKMLWSGPFARCSQQTLKICLGVASLPSILPPGLTVIANVRAEVSQ